MALASLGTDTRASIRVPAALSGAVGFRPTTGVVPVDRWLTLSWSLDVLAPMARSVRDIALLMDVLTASGQVYRRRLAGTASKVCASPTAIPSSPAPSRLSRHCSMTRCTP